MIGYHQQHTSECRKISETEISMDRLRKHIFNNFYLALFPSEITRIKINILDIAYPYQTTEVI